MDCSIPLCFLVADKTEEPQQSKPEGASPAAVQSHGSTTKLLGHYKVKSTVSIKSNYALVDAGSWPLEWLLAPQFYLPESLADLVEQTIDVTSKRLSLQVGRVQASKQAQRKFESDTLAAIVGFQSDIRKQVGAYCELGRLISEKYREKTGEKFVAKNVSELVDVYEQGTDPEELETVVNISWDLKAKFAEYHSIRAPVRKNKGGKITGQKKHSVIRKAFGELAKGRFSFEESPIVYGFFPEEMADAMVPVRGFMEGGAALQLGHGKNSHAGHISALLHKDLLASCDDVKALVDNGLWGILFDINPYSLMDYEEENDFVTVLQELGFHSDKINHLLLIGVRRRLMGNTPYTLHNILIFGELSVALQSLYNAKQFDVLNEMLGLHKIGGNINCEAIQKAIEDCKVLETYLASSYFNSIDKILPALKGCQTELDIYRTSPETLRADFVTSPYNNQTRRAKLRRLMAAGKSVYVVKHNWKGGSRLEKADPQHHSNHQGGFIQLKGDSHSLPEELRIFERDVQEDRCCCRLM